MRLVLASYACNIACFNVLIVHFVPIRFEANLPHLKDSIRHSRGGTTRAPSRAPCFKQQKPHTQRLACE
eukprot:COSAG06_NODE_826_length_12064_cov_8.219975_9_plen_69_part_00